jgi:hypothetical protein
MAIPADIIAEIAILGLSSEQMLERDPAFAAKFEAARAAIEGGA